MGLVSIVAAAGIAGSIGSEPVDTTAAQSATPTPVWIYFATPVTHKSGEVTYRYRILNTGLGPIAEIQIGIAPSLEEPELSEAPIGWDPDSNNCPPSMRVPPGWTGCIGRQEESDRFYLIITAKGDSTCLHPGSELSVNVMVARADSAYRKARFFALSTSLPNYEGKVTPEDEP